MEEIFKKVKRAAAQINTAKSELKSKILTDLALLVEQNIAQIMLENQKDLDNMDKADPKYDRLLLTEKRIHGLADSLKNVAQLPDPAGKTLLEKTLPNGLKLSKIATPMGVIGIIYESRPNVTIDVASLCLRSGNAAILKGGKEAHFSNTFLVSLIHQALEKNELSPDMVSLLPSDRSYTEALLKAAKYVDVIIPRGSENLINYVRNNSTIPTIETGAGVCHTYVEKTADPGMAAQIVVNAKVTRPSVCNSLDTIIADQTIVDQLIPLMSQGMAAAQVEIYADEYAYPVFEANNYPYLKRATNEDFGREWLDFKCSFKTVNHSSDAFEHIETYSSRHSESIVTEDIALAEQFLMQIDAAAVYHNASTRFTDGEEFGLGAEIGISTQKLHARGPFALEKLVTEKWVVRGNGQIR